VGYRGVQVPNHAARLGSDRCYVCSIGGCQRGIQGAADRHSFHVYDEDPVHTLVRAYAL
jgi:hypothetical protein